MKYKVISICFALFSTLHGFTQINNTTMGIVVNNLVHTPGYRTSEYGVLPQYVKSGNGKQILILIPGLGFDFSVFKDFMEANKSNYTMYAITIPGYGNTFAPPMPDTGTSYGAQTWNKGALEGLVKLIEKEKLYNPIVVGHFVQGVQLAIRLAIDYPNKVGGLILLGGPAKFIPIVKGKPMEYSLKSAIDYTDKYTAPNWFMSINKDTFDQGNYLPDIYSLDSARGSLLWKQSAAVELPVMVRYLCEYFASDIKLELDKIKCPVLVLRATFNDKVLRTPINSFVRPQFIDSWNNVTSKNMLIKVIDIKETASFLWKDNPADVYKEISSFTKTIH